MDGKLYWQGGDADYWTATPTNSATANRFYMQSGMAFVQGGDQKEDSLALQYDFENNILWDGYTASS